MTAAINLLSDLFTGQVSADGSADAVQDRFSIPEEFWFEVSANKDGATGSIVVTIETSDDDGETWSSVATFSASADKVDSHMEPSDEISDLLRARWDLTGSATWGLSIMAHGHTDGTSATGLPAGGTTGQVLKKVSNADGDADWDDESGGGSQTVRSVTVTIPSAALLAMDGTPDTDYEIVPAPGANKILSPVDTGTWLLIFGTTPYDSGPTLSLFFKGSTPNVHDIFNTNSAIVAATASSFYTEACPWFGILALAESVNKSWVVNIAGDPLANGDSDMQLTINYVVIDVPA